MNSLFPVFSTFYSEIVEKWNEKPNNHENRGVKVFDSVEIPGCSDKLRRLFPTDKKALLKDSEITRSVVHSSENQPDYAIEIGKMPVQGRVENYANA